MKVTDGNSWNNSCKEIDWRVCSLGLSESSPFQVLLFSENTIALPLSDVTRSYREAERVSTFLTMVSGSYMNEHILLDVA